jgi:hypothetical protein
VFFLSSSSSSCLSVVETTKREIASMSLFHLFLFYMCEMTPELRRKIILVEKLRGKERMHKHVELKKGSSSSFFLMTIG